MIVSFDAVVETLTLIVDVSKIARKNILAIEDALPSIENLFLRGGLRLVVDRADREALVEMMAHEVKYTMAGKDNDIAVVGTMASLCPAWGMLGTLVGLVLLLQNLDDPSAIGPAMAVALLTTLYGAMIANTIFMPIVIKLKGYSAYEVTYREMIITGLQFISRGESPRNIQDQLVANLAPKEKQKLIESEAA